MAMESYDDMLKEFDEFILILEHNPNTWRSKKRFGRSPTDDYVNDFNDQRSRLVVAINDVLNDGFGLKEHHHIRKLKRLLESQGFSDTWFPVIDQERTEFLQITEEGRTEIVNQYKEWQERRSGTKKRAAPRAVVVAPEDVPQEREQASAEEEDSTGCGKTASLVGFGIAMTAAIVWFWNKYPEFTHGATPQEHTDLIARVAGTITVTFGLCGMIIGLLNYYKK